MKKFLSISISIIVILSLCACKKADSLSSFDNNSQPTIQSEIANSNADEIITEETTVNPENKKTESEVTDKGSNVTENSDIKTSDNTTTENQHIHNFSAATCTEPQKCTCGATNGNALGHSWQEATCKTPKTCKVCNITDGNISEHNYDKFVCTFCGFKDEEGIAIATNPKLSLRKEPYAYGIINESTSDKVTSTLSIRELFFWNDGRVTMGIMGYFESDNGIIFNYKGKNYTDASGQGWGYDYKLTDFEIMITENENLVAKLKLNIDGTLTVTEKKDGFNFIYFDTGDILSPNFENKAVKYPGDSLNYYVVPI